MMDMTQEMNTGEMKKKMRVVMSSDMARERFNKNLQKLMTLESQIMMPKDETQDQKNAS